MPRIARVCPTDSVVHVVNRGIERRRLFDRSEDYDDFLELLDRTLATRAMRLLGYGLMPNHWHLVLWPAGKTELSRFLHYLTTLHASRIRSLTGTAGLGHVYQSRFHSSVVHNDERYVRAVRYVEANPLRAGLVQDALDWPWTSLTERVGPRQRIVDGPVSLPDPAHWARLVNASEGRVGPSDR